MTRLRCPHCSAGLRPATTRCSSCGKSIAATELSAEAKRTLFAEIEDIADELGWVELPGIDRKRVLNEAWVIVPLVVGFIFSTLSKMLEQRRASAPDFQDQLTEWIFFSPGSIPVAMSLSVVLALVGWFIARHRATEVEVEEILVDYHPAIAVEKNRVRSFPLLPERPMVVLELEGGKQTAFGTDPHCFDSVIEGRAGFALVASNRLLAFMTIDDA